MVGREIESEIGLPTLPSVSPNLTFDLMTSCIENDPMSAQNPTSLLICYLGKLPQVIF